MKAARFNSHEILVKHYAEQIRKWGWKPIIQSASDNVHVDDVGNKVRCAWLGTTLGLMPSGKYYTCWTSNQTLSDVRKDQAFDDALHRVAKEHDAYIEWDDDDCFVCFIVESAYAFDCGYE